MNNKAQLEVVDLSKFPAFNKYSVGFEEIFERIERMDQWANSANKSYNAYPPYNIEQIDENSYVVSLAVAGFGRNDVTITTKDSRLTIKGEKTKIEEVKESGGEDATPKFVHKGIATRDFELYFNLSDHVEVIAASFNDGLLAISLERKIPEALKERVIKIK